MGATGQPQPSEICLSQPGTAQQGQQSGLLCQATWAQGPVIGLPKLP